MSGESALLVAGGSSGVALLKLIVALVVVLAAFYAFARLMRRFGASGAGSVAGLSVVGSLALGQRERLVVLDVGDERIVLGVTAHSITRVHVLPETGEGTRSLDQGPVAPGAGRATPLGPAFADRLRSALLRQPAGARGAD